MAFNFITDERYDINFDEMESILKQNNPSSFQYFNSWIEGWMEVLKHSDQDTDKQIANFRNNPVLLEGMEVYQKSIYFPSFHFPLHFFIPGANAFIKNKNPKIHNISLKNVLNGKFSLDWSPTSDWKKSVNNHKPVICISFPHSTHEFLSIDGNHRLTAKINTKQNSIKAYIIDPKDIVEEHILLSTVDKAFYLFIIESANFSKAFTENKYSHEEIFSSSLLHSAFSYVFE